MRIRYAVTLGLALAFGFLDQGAWAASYQKIDGTIVDPILDRQGNVHGYSGPNLEPGMSSSVYLTNAQLSQADLRNADLPESNFEDADLSGSSLSGANFSVARFARSILSYANLQNTSLFRSSLSFADLSNATLDGADLSQASLSMANLAGASFIGAYYDENTTFPIGFDPVAAGMISGPTIVNNGLAPPAPTNVFYNPVRDLIINNVGCNALVEWPCMSPASSTSVGGLAREVSVFESSSFSGSVFESIVLHDDSTANALLTCGNCSLRAFENSSAMVEAQADEADITADGNAFVHAIGAAWEDITARGQSHVIFEGSDAEGAAFFVYDDALLEISSDLYWLDVNGGRAILHSGDVYVGVDVSPGGVLENLGGSLEASNQPYGDAIRIGGELEMSGGSIGPGELLVDGYASLTGGAVYAESTPSEYPGGAAGPWNFFAAGDGLIHVSGGSIDDSDGNGPGYVPSHLGARDSSRIRLFGSGYTVGGQSIPTGSIETPTGTLIGTLASGDPINNVFAHRGADCGGQPCTGRILVLASGLDWDQDAIPNPFDNCAEEPNADQADLDEDGTGDVCFAPVDLDRDGIVDAVDNCRVDANPDQLDTDSDGIGDACEKNLIFWADKGLEGCTTPPKRLPYELVTNDLGNGDVIDRSTLPCDCFGIEYPVTPGTASVRFLHRTESGFVEEYCENVAPYALGLGPNQPICADGLDEDGLHELMATPYDAPGCEAGGGNALPSSIRSFTMAAPEPGLAVMVGVGALGLAGISRRRTRCEG